MNSITRVFIAADPSTGPQLILEVASPGPMCWVDPSAVDRWCYGVTIRSDAEVDFTGLIHHLSVDTLEAFCNGLSGINPYGDRN